MALKVEIYEKEIVRPFSPTPESLRNYKLSYLDQNSGTHYTPTVFFYSSSASHHHDYDNLKESLSKTLSILYPLAGRVAKDGMTIECNDKGVDFVRANVTNYDLADFLRGCPKVDALQRLLPRDPFPMEFDYSQPLLGVQVSKFGCGGTAVATCLWHGVADGAALGRFVLTWATINWGEVVTNSPEKFIADPTKTFPPRPNFDFSGPTSSYGAERKEPKPNCSAKRLVFSKQEIERMRDEHNLSDHHRRPSRVEALSAFIWAAVIRATLKANRDIKTIILTQTVDVRKRMNPPFPSMCLGNIFYICATQWVAHERGGNDVVTPQSLIGTIREAIARVSDSYVREMLAKLQAAEMGNILSSYTHNSVKLFGIISECGFSFHKCNFGWGKPIWFVPAVTIPRDGAYLFDSTTDDGGIEVWIGLTNQVMSNLDKDNEFLARVSSSQIILESYHLPSNL